MVLHLSCVSWVSGNKTKRKIKTKEQKETKTIKKNPWFFIRHLGSVLKNKD
jgi:hypothetical protein